MTNLYIGQRVFGAYGDRIDLHRLGSVVDDGLVLWDSGGVDGVDPSGRIPFDGGHVVAATITRRLRAVVGRLLRAAADSVLDARC